MLRKLIKQKRIIVCVGPGGVGKTTIAASIATKAAQMGKRTLVSTVDPAPRLWDALGLPQDATGQTELDEKKSRTLDIQAPGSLAVATLNIRKTFKSLVESSVPNTQIRNRILENPIYEDLISNVSGAHEYAAMLSFEEKVRNEYDTLVIDTPPAQHAVDFINSPDKLLSILQSPLLSWLTKKTSTNKSARLFSLFRLRKTGSLVLHGLGRLAGSAFLNNLGNFLTDFQQVTHALECRSVSCKKLFKNTDLCFIIVSAPTKASANESLSLQKQLAKAGFSCSGVVLNGMAPNVTREEGMESAFSSSALKQKFLNDNLLDYETAVEVSAALATTYEHLNAKNQEEAQALIKFKNTCPNMPLRTIPAVAADIDMLSTLNSIAKKLE